MKQLVLITILSFSSLAMAGEVGGIEVPDNMTVGGQELVLNGAGLRKKFFIKVYAGALYLKSKSSDAAAIVAADEPMAIRMHFNYGVGPDKLIEAWNEGFENATGGNTAPIKAQIDAFNALFTEKTKKKDEYVLSYVPGTGVTVHFNGELKSTIEGADFKKALFGIWLGEKPADDNLKEGMLGQ